MRFLPALAYVAALLAAEHAQSQDAKPTIDATIINTYHQSLCLLPVKVPDEGNPVALASAPKPADDQKFDVLSVTERQKAIAPLLGPFLTGDPLSAPSLPMLEPAATAAGSAQDRAAATDIAAAGKSGGVMLETSTEDSRGALVYSTTSSSGGGALSLSSIELSAPLSKQSDTQIQRMGEFASDARLKISRTWFGRAWTSGVPDPSTLQDIQKKTRCAIRREVEEQCGCNPADRDVDDCGEAACRAQSAEATKSSQECQEKRALMARVKAENILPKGDCAKKYAGEGAFQKYVDSYFKPQRALFMGITASVGYLEFDFMDAGTIDPDTGTFEKNSTTQTPWGAGVFFGRYSADRKNLIRLGYDYVRGYKAADDSIACRVPDPALPPECQTGKFSGPVDDDGDAGFIELRRTFPSRFVQAFTVKYSYDFDKKQSEVDVPVYLFKNAKGDLNGGVRLDWNEEEDFGIGIFVGAAFSTDF